MDYELREHQTADDVPVVAMLHALVNRIRNDIPGALGASISVQHKDGPLTVLAAVGVAEHFGPAQVQLGIGPLVDAAARKEPTTTGDVFTDPRWPGLTVDALAARFPEPAPTLSEVRGVAALPTCFEDASTLVLSAILKHPAVDEASRVLTRYEDLVTAALVLTETKGDGGSEQLIAFLQSRALLEQAKGAIIAVRNCSSDEAWTTLRRASQHFNVKVRELAVALIEHLSHTLSATPPGVPDIVPSAEARRAAKLLWEAFSTSS